MRLTRVAGLLVGGGFLAMLSTQTALAQATTPEGRLKILQDQINALQSQLEQLKGTVETKTETGPIVTFPNNRTALVRFSTDEKSATNVVTRNWVSLVRFRYSGAPMRNEWRFDNPLGFQVVEYRRDQESVPSPASAGAQP